MQRLPIVGVMGSGTFVDAPRAHELGRWLATEGVHLLTGAGGGAMAAVSEAFHDTPGRRGLVIGIVPASDDPAVPKPGYPNRWVEIPIHTHLALSGAQGTDVRSRNHINVLTSHVLVALAGGPGTASEVALALRYGRPIVAYVGARAEISGLLPGVAALRELGDVQQFVREHLALAKRDTDG
jgi:uncharacterized protein (TIGR00725 family)